MSTIRILFVSAALAGVALAHPHHPIVEFEGSLDPRALSARPRFGNLPYGMSLTECAGDNMIALTFDDGPGPFTAHVLDLLKQAGNLKASFFLNGQNGNGGITVPELQPVVKRMIAEGHLVGSHSFSHANFDEITEDERVQELVKNEDAFAALLGFVPSYFRPPFTACGAECQATATKLGYRITDYNLDTKDFEGDYVKAMNTFQQGVSQNPKSFISLAHDIHERTSNELVPFMIQQAKDQGYRFVTIGECLGDPAENWYRDPQTGQPFGVVKPSAAPAASTTAAPSQASSSSAAATPSKASSTSATAAPSKASSTSSSAAASSASSNTRAMMTMTSGTSTSTRAATNSTTTTRLGGGAAVPVFSTGTPANGTRPAVGTGSQPPRTTLPIKGDAGRAMASFQTVAVAALACALLI